MMRRAWNYVMVGCVALLMQEGAARTTDSEVLLSWWRASDGRSVRRLPVGLLPENAFWVIESRDFPDGFKAFGRMMDESFARSTYNCVTLSLRCNRELGDPETLAAVRRCCERAHAEGVKVYLDSDPRIARREFFDRWPEDRQSVLVVSTSLPTNGTASFTTVFKPVQDHMSWGSKSAYRPLDGRLVSAYAIRRRADGALDFATRRKVETKTEVSMREWRKGRLPADPGDEDPNMGYTDFSEVTVRGTAAGLADDETLVTVSVSAFFAVDVFSPRLLSFCRELMTRAKEVGADGGMRDEWGFLPNPTGDTRQIFWSSHFEAAYRKSCGRSLLDDAALMAVGPTGDAERSKAIGAYMRLVLDRNVEIERDFYETDKCLFGDDVYVVKHPTWYANPCPPEYLHNGFDWWQAPRDWAQGDEQTPVYALNAMAKKFGGPVWLNEGWTPTSGQNAYRVWAYAMCGGRQVYHPLYGNPADMKPYDGLPWNERRVRTYVDLLRRENVIAQARVRLVNLITRAQVDSPLACVFGHEELVDWSSPKWNDHGKRQILALMEKGWWCDAFPASELALGTFAVDDDGWLCVGRQRYAALVLWRLRSNEQARLDALTAGKSVKTRILDLRNADAVCESLRQVGGARQPAVKKLDQAGGFYPQPNGVLRLLDGTAVRIRADQGNLCGLPVSGRLTSNGTDVSFSAEGVFAARVEQGTVVAVAAGGLKHVTGTGLSLELERPEDVALLKIGDEWHGVWQTACREAPVPESLRRLTCHWTKLLLPEHVGR